MCYNYFDKLTYRKEHIMKKLLAFFMALIMLIPMTLCVNATDTTPEVPVFGNSLNFTSNYTTTATTTPKFSTSSNSSMNLSGVSGYGTSLEIPTTVTSVSWRSATRYLFVEGEEPTDATLAKADSGNVLTRGTYEVSIYIYTEKDGEKQGIVAGNANTEFGVELYPTTTSESFTKGNGGVYVKFLNADGSTAEGITTTDTKVGSRTWTKYTATVTLDKSCAKFCLWATSNGAIDAKVTTYFDELSVEKVSEHTAPVLAGAQISGIYEHGEGEAVSVRFLGGIDSYENYEALGFRIAYRYSDGSGNPEFTYRDIQSDSVYTSVLADSSGKHVAVKSINYGMKYFYATSIDGIEIKTSGQYEFIITPVAIEKDTHKELVLESCRYVITASSGAFNMSRFGRVDMDSLPTDYASLNSQMG